MINQINACVNHPLLECSSWSSRREDRKEHENTDMLAREDYNRTTEHVSEKLRVDVTFSSGIFFLDEIRRTLPSFLWCSASDEDWNCVFVDDQFMYSPQIRAGVFLQPVGESTFESSGTARARIEPKFIIFALKMSIISI